MNFEKLRQLGTKDGGQTPKELLNSDRRTNASSNLVAFANV
jgi:hypothetical protein